MRMFCLPILIPFYSANTRNSYVQLAFERCVVDLVGVFTAAGWQILPIGKRLPIP
jgi:hypothetical protein